MRRPSGSSRDESIAGKWSDLRQYEEDQEAALREAHQVFYKSREFLPSLHFIVAFSYMLKMKLRPTTRILDTPSGCGE